MSLDNLGCFFNINVPLGHTFVLGILTRAGAHFISHECLIDKLARSIGMFQDEFLFLWRVFHGLKLVHIHYIVQKSGSQPPISRPRCDFLIACTAPCNRTRRIHRTNLHQPSFSRCPRSATSTADPIPPFHAEQACTHTKKNTSRQLSLCTLPPSLHLFWALEALQDVQLLDTGQGGGQEQELKSDGSSRDVELG